MSHARKIPILRIYPDYITETIYKALKSIPGVEIPRDGHAGSHGVFWYPVSVDPKTKRRSYSRTGHWDNLKRPNYHLLTGARVNKIVVEAGAARGVQFLMKNSNKTTAVGARNEVILSAGTIHTPQILQLSGIGPRKVLNEAGVKTQVDLPGVGSNFQDHPIGPPVLFECKTYTSTPELSTNCLRGKGATCSTN